MADTPFGTIEDVYTKANELSRGGDDEQDFVTKKN